VRGEARDRIGITFDDEQVRRVHLVEVALTNTGNAPILSADFERPLRVSLEGDSRILTVEVTKTKPEELEPPVTFEPSRIEIGPLLLNPGDGLTAAALVADLEGSPSLDGRVAGVSALSNTPTDSTSRFQGPLALIGVALALAFSSATSAAQIVIDLLDDDETERSEVVLKSGERLCGDIKSVTGKGLEISTDSGTRTFPLESLAGFAAGGVDCR